MTARDMFPHLPATLITRHTRHTRHAALAHNRDVDAGSRGEFVVRRCKSHGSLPKGTAIVGFMMGICPRGEDSRDRFARDIHIRVRQHAAGGRPGWKPPRTALADDDRTGFRRKWFRPGRDGRFGRAARPAQGEPLGVRASFALVQGGRASSLGQKTARCFDSYAQAGLWCRVLS